MKRTEAILAAVSEIRKTGIPQVVCIDAREATLNDIADKFQIQPYGAGILSKPYMVRLELVSPAIVDAIDKVLKNFVPNLFCECEHNDCDIHEDKTCVGEDLQIVHTIYGKYRICKECRERHPIPSDFLATEKTA